MRNSVSELFGDRMSLLAQESLDGFYLTLVGLYVSSSRWIVTGEMHFTSKKGRSENIGFYPWVDEHSFLSTLIDGVRNIFSEDIISVFGLHLKLYISGFPAQEPSSKVLADY